MPIPDRYSIMLPLLELLEDSQEHHVHDVIRPLEDKFHLTEQERIALLPSGGTVFSD